MVDTNPKPPLKWQWILDILFPLQAETELRIAQADYDKQVEITKLLMEGLSSIQTNHLSHLHDFVEAQVKYFAECHQCMQELERELSR